MAMWTANSVRKRSFHDCKDADIEKANRTVLAITTHDSPHRVRNVWRLIRVQLHSVMLLGGRGAGLRQPQHVADRQTEYGTALRSAARRQRGYAGFPPTRQE